jgi:hypothetical protein
VLLLDGQPRPIKLWIPLAQFLAQDGDLRVLAAKNEHGCSGDIRMIDVTGDEAAAIIGVFARAAAAPVVQQKTGANYVGKNAGTLGTGSAWREDVGFDFRGAAFLVEARDIGNLLAVKLRRGEAEFFLKGLF